MIELKASISPSSGSALAVLADNLKVSFVIVKVDDPDTLEAFVSWHFNHDRNLQSLEGALKMLVRLRPCGAWTGTEELVKLIRKHPNVLGPFVSWHYNHDRNLESTDQALDLLTQFARSRTRNPIINRYDNALWRNITQATDRLEGARLVLHLLNPATKLL
jgi:hypothetical protein